MIMLPQKTDPKSNIKKRVHFKGLNVLLDVPKQFARTDEIFIKLSE